MCSDTDRKDFSKDYLREMLVHQRQFMWYPDSLEKFSAWLELRHGMTAVDVGCGLGYLGYTYWPYIGKGGTYVGIDHSDKLINDAREAAKEWAEGGTVDFICGSVYDIPLPDNHADIVMCQTLLMHLEFPEKALKEMTRIAKPGGLVVCKEPDNLSSTLAKPFHSLPEFDLDTILLFTKVSLICRQGRLKLGKGDFNMGSRVPHLMKESGLIDIDLRMNDRVFYLEPPYETPLQKHRLKGIKGRWLNDKNYRFMLDESREEFLAGDGDPDELERFVKICEDIRKMISEQLENETYYACGGTLFYIIKGMKPE